MTMRQSTGKPDRSNLDIDAKTDEAGGRWAAKAALLAVLELDWDEPINSEPRAALWRLLTALDSLEHGKVHDMLKPVSIENRPTDAIDEQCNRALVAAAMDALMRSASNLQGKTEEQAARVVARIVHSRQNNVFGRDVTWKNIRGWRQNLNARKSRADIDHDVALYHSLRAYVQNAAVAPEKIVKHLLDLRPW